MGYGLANFVTVDGKRGIVGTTGAITDVGTATDIPVFTGLSASLPQTALMLFGGDARIGQGETVYINAPIITPSSRKEDNTGWDRYVYIDVYAGWYTSPPSPIGVADTIRVTVSSYSGGIMVKPKQDNAVQGLRSTNFYNVAEGTTSESLIDASQIIPPDYTESYKINTQGRGTNAGVFRNPPTLATNYGYPKFCTIRYDRYKRDARIFWDVAIPSPSAPLIMVEEAPPKPKE